MQKESYTLEAKPAHSVEAWWVLVLTCINDQPEKFMENERTINSHENYLRNMLLLGMYNGNDRLQRE